jgi:methylaspartate ammonia-lyase
LIQRAHHAGLAIAQKNTSELARAGRRAGFDFTIAEECQVYSECGAYTGAYGRESIEIEYPDNGGTANLLAACHARGTRITSSTGIVTCFPADNTATWSAGAPQRSS